MISTKMTTQGWSKAKQTHDFGDDPQRRYTSATESTEASANVGEKLNQIANPGGKDSGGHKVRRAHNSLDKDDFLKLMLTQMKNQDPFNPMQNHEMAAQLAQFTSLEQMYNMNKNLEGISNKQDPLAKYEALNFLGKTIKADTREIFKNVGESANELRFNLAGEAAKVKIKIFDQTGKVVREIETGKMSQGPAKIVWDGVDQRKQEAPAGKYMFQAEAENNSGNKVTVQTETKGTITGINYSPEGPLLMVGDQKVRLADVQKIEDSELRNVQSNLELKAGVQTGQPLMMPSGMPDAKRHAPQVDDKKMSTKEDADSATLSSGVQAYQKAIQKNRPEERPTLKATDVVSPLGALTQTPFINKG